MTEPWTGDAQNVPRVGVVLPLWPRQSPGEIFEVAATVSRHPFAEMWLGEMGTWDAMSAMAACISGLAERTTATVGPVPVGVRTPVDLALGLATLGQVSGRAVDLALGASVASIVAGWHGRPHGQAPERTRELIQALRQILSGEVTDFAGAHVRTSGFRLSGPMRSSVALAAFGPSMVRLAGEVADRAVLNQVTPGEVARIRSELTEAAANVGRPCPEVVVWMMSSLRDDPDSVGQIARNVAIYLRQPRYRSMYEKLGSGRDLRSLAAMSVSEATRAVPRSLLDAVAAIGPAAVQNSRIDALRRAGADVVCVVPATAGDAGARGLLAELATVCQ
ncbi:LLM class F420-dependent oxidoreductase [Nocardioides marmoriginsengisoli]|uniref:LLM class F420-dependent oxidoreductase n=1 Tax=Nocardioides marmoriginsengisoli TaxID=661483 RepID=A0A3N0CHI5_9ACTN|nr:LLM class F420-dependent oxidoreductase [Nocardioides marmoriginsengisoli]